MPEVAAAQTAKHDAIVPQKPRTTHLPLIGPTRRPIRRDVLSFFCSPDREDDRHSHSRNPATRSDAPALQEYLRRVSVELEPPDEKRERLIDRPAPHHEPGESELRLESKAPGRPFGRCPEKGKHDHRYQQELTPEDSGCGHAQRGCASSRNVQQQPARHRNQAHDGVEIGGLKGKVALASKAPFNATRTCNAVHLPSKFALEGGYPGHELKAQAIVDHCKAA